MEERPFDFWIYVGITFFSNLWRRPSPAVRPGNARRQRLPPSSFRKSHGGRNLLLAHRRFQFFNLLEVRSSVSAHPLH